MEGRRIASKCSSPTSKTFDYAEVSPGRGAGSSIRPVGCLRPFGAPGKGEALGPGVKTPGFMPTPPSGLDRCEHATGTPAPRSPVLKAASYAPEAQSAKHRRPLMGARAGRANGL